MRVLLILLLIHGSAKGFSQTRDLKSKCATEHSMYFELGGNALIYSMNYLQRQIKSDSLIISYRIGFAVLPSWGFTIENGVFVPVEIAFETSQKLKGLEYGFGATYVHLIDDDRTSIQCYLVPKIGYRHDFELNNSFVRMAITPIFPLSLYNSNTRDDKPPTLLPWVGIGVGWDIK